MTKTWTFSFLLLILCCTSTLFAQIAQYENQIINQIEVIVHTQNGAISDNPAVSAKMKTKDGAFFSQASFDDDLKMLSEEYDRIEPSLTVENELVNIKIDLWAKPLIRAIQWHGNHKVVTSRLQKELGIKVLSTYDRTEFNQTFHKLKAYYMRKGFFEAKLDYQVRMDSNDNEVDIDVYIDEGRSGKIEKIKFVNLCENEEHDILGQMVTKKYNMFTSWFTEEGVYNEDAIQQDQLIITNYLQNQGYADAQVSIEVTESPKTNRIIVTIIADKGERYYFGDLTFEGNKVVPDDQIDKVFLIRPGQPYSMEKIRDTIEKLTDAYGKLGYIEVLIDFEPDLDDDQRHYNVQFKIEEGDQFHVGLVRVFGNRITQTPVILHETLMIPGEVFNTLKLKATEIRLQNMGFFKNVNVYIAKGTESQSLGGNYRDVYIEVEETNTGQFNAFLGYSNAEELFAGFTISENNFNYEGIHRLWRDGLKSLRGGGEYASFNAQIGQKSSNFQLSWTKPYFRDTKWTVGFDLASGSARYISRDYTLQSSSLILRANYDINPYVRFGMQYRLSNGVVSLHHNGNKFHELKSESHIHGLISAIGTSLEYSRINHPMKPTKGFKSKLIIEYAGIGGDHTFFNFSYFNSYYFPVGSRVFIKYRADFRFIQPIGHTHYSTLPLDERFFLGGDYMLRGYRQFRLGPQYGHGRHGHVARGGISLQLLSVEITRKITKDFDIFSFFDSGYLSKKTWDFGRMSVAAGVGTRFKLLDSLPPVTMGMGYPINAQNDSEVKRFFLNFGASY